MDPTTSSVFEVSGYTAKCFFQDPLAHAVGGNGVLTKILCCFPCLEQESLVRFSQL